MSTLHRVTVVVGNVAERSRTKVLASAIVERLGASIPIETRLLEIHRLAPHIASACMPSQLNREGAAAIEAIETADLLVAVTPVYKGSYSGMFKHLFDLVGPDALIGHPVLLAANGGSDRHALVVDHQLRPLFSFFRALSVPSAVYAAERDFDGYVLNSERLQQRIDEAAAEAVQLLARSAAPLAESRLQDQLA